MRVLFVRLGVAFALVPTEAWVWNVRVLVSTPLLHETCTRQNSGRVITGCDCDVCMHV